MENIPMKVETKTMAFTDPTAVANDRLTGETSIIAFRATALPSFTNYEPGNLFDFRDLFSSSNLFTNSSELDKY